MSLHHLIAHLFLCHRIAWHDIPSPLSCKKTCTSRKIWSTNVLKGGNDIRLFKEATSRLNPLYFSFLSRWVDATIAQTLLASTNRISGCFVNSITDLETHLHVNHVPLRHEFFHIHHRVISLWQLERKFCKLSWQQLFGYSRIRGHYGGTTEFLVAGVLPEVVKTMGRWL